MTMTRYLYSNISFLFLNLGVLSFIFGILLLSNECVYFIDWCLGGRRLSFSVTFFIDAIACVFMATVFLISSNVVYYRRSYMSRDPNADRFIILVFSFVVSIILLITSPNLVRILLG